MEANANKMTYPITLSDISSIGDNDAITNFLETLLKDMSAFEEIKNPTVNILECLGNAKIYQYQAAFYMMKDGKPFCILGFNPAKMSYTMMIISTVTETNHRMLIQKLMSRIEGYIRRKKPDIEVEYYLETSALAVADYLFLKLTSQHDDWHLNTHLTRN